MLGHSWGAGVAALYAMRYPDHVGRLIIVGGIPLRQTELSETFRRIRSGGDSAWRNELKTRGDARRADPGSATACRAYYEAGFMPFYGDPAAARKSKGDFCAGGSESLRNKVASVDRFTIASLGDYDWRASLRSVKSLTLVIHGTVDVMSIASANEWATTLPNARLLLLPGVGHFPYLEAPEPFFAAVERFTRGDWPEEAHPVAKSQQN